MSGKIYVTGDCHSQFERFNTKNFPQQKAMNKDDYMIICGDFGGVWDVDKEGIEEEYWLNWLNDKNYTTLFIDGNHENFERLNAYPEKMWHGGKIHEIRPSVLHLLRGQIYDIAGQTFFTFGGASSHDIEGGIFEPDDPHLKEKMRDARRSGLPYRVNRISWWQEELPSQAEYQEAIANLEKVDYKVDYIITHCCASTTQYAMSGGIFKEDELTDFLDIIKKRCEWRKWYFGHYHGDKEISDKEILLYKGFQSLGRNS